MPIPFTSSLTHSLNQFHHSSLSVGLDRETYVVTFENWRNEMTGGPVVTSKRDVKFLH